MKLFDFFKKDKSSVELTNEQIVDKCRNGSLTAEDIMNSRVINLLYIAQSFYDNNEIDCAESIIELSIQNRPSNLMGEFVALHDELHINGIQVYKTRLDTMEDREVFYKLYKRGHITNANIGEVDEEMQEKIDLAFDEGFKRESEYNFYDDYLLMEPQEDNEENEEEKREEEDNSDKVIDFQEIDEHEIEM